MDLTPEIGKKKHKLSLNWPVQNQFPTIQQAWDFPVQRTKLTLSSAEQQFLLKPANINSMTIHPLHREKRLDWRRGSTARCRVPEALSNHDKRGKKWPKCDRGIRKIDL